MSVSRLHLKEEYSLKFFAGSLAIHRVTQKLDLYRLFAQCVLSQQCTDSVDTLPRWSILVEEVTGEEDKVDLQAHEQLRFKLV